MTLDLHRYHRQMLLPGIGEEGQGRLMASTAVVVGCGALGCASADLLARAGVGKLILIDRDVVELTNLQRQCLFDERDAAEGTPKAEAARRRLAAVNSGITVQARVADLHAANAEELLAGAGVIVDGTDNFETRYLLNDVSVKRGVAYCYGGVVGTRGMQATFVPGRTACLRCVFEAPPPAGSTPTCDTAGVLGPVVQIVGACQAADALKVLLGRLDLLSGTLLDMDLWANRRRRVELSGARRDCPCCGGRRLEFLDGERAGLATSLCGRHAVQVRPPETVRFDLPGLARRLSPHGEFTATMFLVRGVLRGEQGEDGPLGLTVFSDGRALVHGTDRPEVARGVYARYVGA